MSFAQRKIQLPPPPTGRILASSHVHHTKEAAGFVIRAVALFLDSAILSIAGQILSKVTLLAFSWLGLVHQGPLLGFLFLIQLGVIYILYWKPLCEKGQSYGKKWLKIQIVSEDGDLIASKEMMKREVIGKILSAVSLVGYLMALGSKKLALHDRLFKTRVIRVGS